MKQNKPNINMLKFYLETKIYLNEWKNILHLWVEISNIVDMSVFSKLILKFRKKTGEITLPVFSSYCKTVQIMAVLY